MAVIKCKMCGGDLQIEGDMRYGTCAYCGSVMTLPNVTDQHKENLYLRAEQFRHMNQFDQALYAYETILSEDANDPEAHWGALISRYGIEYVEDPVSHQRIPTCHRVQYTSILSDADYLAALENAADDYAKELYQTEAARIFEIQKQILEISAKEEPYDVFICYKETTEGGVRTKDSIAAQDIYDHLCETGLKVFFARVTLEGKLGTAYEPIIFAALNSAKVMLVIGTSPEFVRATWVRNEWSRYLALMKNNPGKVMIPCYSGMNPYDFPEELKMLQSQDMTKVGFLQDLTVGILTILKNSSSIQQEDVPTEIDQEQIAEWNQRAWEAIQGKNFSEAGLILDKVLRYDSTNALAMYYSILVSSKVSNENMILPFFLKKNHNFDRIMHYADEVLTEKLHKIIAKKEPPITAPAAQTADKIQLLLENFNTSQSFRMPEIHIYIPRRLLFRLILLAILVGGTLWGYNYYRNKKEKSLSRYEKKYRPRTFDNYIEQLKQEKKAREEMIAVFQKMNKLEAERTGGWFATPQVTDEICNAIFKYASINQEDDALKKITQHLNEIIKYKGPTQKDIEQRKRKFSEYEMQKAREHSARCASVYEFSRKYTDKNEKEKRTADKKPDKSDALSSFL